MGLVLEENVGGYGGLRVKEIAEGGSAQVGVFFFCGSGCDGKAIAASVVVVTTTAVVVFDKGRSHCLLSHCWMVRIGTCRRQLLAFVVSVGVRLKQ